MDIRKAAVRLQQALRERLGIQAKIKTGPPGDMIVWVDGKSVFAYKQQGSMPGIDELVQRVEAVHTL